MKVQLLLIPAVLPSLNQLIGGRVRDRIRLKRQWLDVVIGLAHAQKLQPAGAVRMRYDFWESRGGRGRDPSNILAGAAKIIEDALVQAGILAGDDQTVIKGIVLGDIIHAPRNPGVRVTLESV